MEHNPKITRYKCLKAPLSKIVVDDHVSSVINDASFRTTRIIHKAYMILRFFALDSFENSHTIPIFTQDTGRMAICSVQLKRGDIKGNNRILLDKFIEYTKFLDCPLEDGQLLTQILIYYSTTILTAIETNVKVHYLDYLRRYVNVMFNVHSVPRNERTTLKKKLAFVKRDLINDTFTSDPEFHDWIQQTRIKILPENFHKNGFYYDLASFPQRYLSFMFIMNLDIEKQNGKMFQPFPQQSSLIPKHVTIDTRTVIILLYGEGKTKLLNDISGNKEFVWDRFFRITHKVKNYVFDHTIVTDGYSASIRFIHKDDIETKNGQMKKRKNAKDVAMLSKKRIKIQQESGHYINYDPDPGYEYYNFYSFYYYLEPVYDPDPANNLDIVIAEKVKVTKPKKTKSMEFPYIDEVDKDEIEKVKHIFIDPGKRSLLTMMDDDGKFLNYTNRQRLMETKYHEYQRLLKNHRTNIGLIDIEKQLTESKVSLKTCNLQKFLKSVKYRLSIEKELFAGYCDPKFRQYKFYSYMNRKRSESKLIDRMEKTFGSDSVVVIGDWSVTKQLRNFISTPGIGLKRKLSEKFKVYMIDEFRTSCLHYKTEDKCENMYVKYRNVESSKKQKLHAVLTYKMENKRMGCVNRDKNGCKNIQKVFESIMETGERPEKYRRGDSKQQSAPTMKSNRKKETRTESGSSSSDAMDL